MVQMTTIAPEDQEDVLSSFWTMLMECESTVLNSKETDVVLKLWVTQWYEQWNRITGDNKKPEWEQ